MKILEKNIQRRNQIAKIYNKEFQDLPLILPKIYNQEITEMFLILM